MKKIFLALTGSIACIKSFDLIKGFQEKGYDVQVILTKGGEIFSSRTALESMSGFPVLGPEIFAFKKTEEYLNPFQENTSEIFAHLELSNNSEALVVAPCSANFLEKMASGRADDFLSTSVLAYQKKIILAPAMNTKMWENVVVQKNIKNIVGSSHGCSLQSNKNISIIPPKNSGILACKEEGAGKMADVEVIVHATVREIFAQNFPEISQKLSGKNMVINLGGTQEKIDPVRYIGNFSTGKTGKILVEKCFELGAENISVVQGNTALASEISAELFDIQKVSSTQEMLEAMDEKFLESDIVIFSAAVSDFIPENCSEEKIKKREVLGDDNDVENSHGCSLHVELKRNTDIAQYFAQKKLPHQIFIGFALETGDDEFLKKSLQKKAAAKKFDIVLGNSPKNIGTEEGKFLAYFSHTGIFQEFSGKKSEIFEEVLTQFAILDIAVTELVEV